MGTAKAQAAVAAGEAGDSSPAAAGEADGGGDRTPGAGRTAVEIRGLTKRFGRTTVLDNVDLTVAAGEIHALVGQNGSGKSTLIKILSGVYTADGGTIEIGGRTLSNPVRPSDLREHGLAFVHQDLGLVDDLTVLENVRVGRYRPGRLSRRIAWSHERSQAQDTFAALNARIPLGAQMGSLPAGQRAVVAIARAVAERAPGAGCVVFDESTQSLPRETLPEFYAILRAVARSGAGILIVSHRLDEVMTLADRVTVLRDGKPAASGVPVSELTEAALSRLILGRELAAGRIESAVARPAEPETVLETTGLSGTTLDRLDLRAYAGEVLGITGGGACGLEEIADLLAGVGRGGSGQVTVSGRQFAVPVKDPGALHEAGLALIPHNRMKDGLAAEVSALANLTLPRVRHRGRFLMSHGWQHREFDAAVRALGVTPASPHAPVASFSGGNQQKLLLAKWLSNSPRVLVACEPTQAVDVGARLDILRALRAAADEGKAVVVCSIEVQDLALVCDRVIVLRPDRDHLELADDLSAEAITDAVYA